MKDANGNLIKTVKGTNKKGFNRVSWKLDHATKRGERLDPPPQQQNFFGGRGIMATPGDYTVTLVKRVDGKTTLLQGPKSFKVVLMYDGALPRKSFDEINSFRKEVTLFQQDLNATNLMLAKNLKQVKAMQRAADKATDSNQALFTRINEVRKTLLELDKALNGNKVKGEIGERSGRTPNNAGFIGVVALSNTYGPTGNHKVALNTAKSRLAKIKSQLGALNDNELSSIERDLKTAGAPYIEGQGLIKN